MSAPLQLGYRSEPADYSRAVDYAAKAVSPSEFRRRLRPWLALFPDAASQAKAMRGVHAYTEFRRGLRAEREKRFSGEPWMQQFGAILIPELAIRAADVADHYKAPWGAALIRLTELLAANAGRAEGRS